MLINFVKKFVYILVFFIFLSNLNAHSSNKAKIYSKENISNYFSGLISAKNNENDLALKYLNNVRDLKNEHDRFNKEFVFTLVQLQKIPEVFTYLKKLKGKNTDFFQANLLLSINYILEKKFTKSKNHLNLIIKNEENYELEKLIARILLSHIYMFENDSDNLIKTINAIPNRYSNILLINDAFINCYFDNEKIDQSFLKLVKSEKSNFTRYKFFYANYLVSQNRYDEALLLLDRNNNLLDNNLLLNQSKLWLEQNKIGKIKDVFDCKNINNLTSEFLYLFANLYSSEENYTLSNFYLNLSLFLNPNFIFNKALLGENYFYLGDYKSAKKIFLSFDSNYPIYEWYAYKRIVFIIRELEDKKSAVNYLTKKFKKIDNPNLNHFFDMANYYKDFEKYEEAIEYYTKVLNNLERHDELYPKILHRRGMSYEKMKLWNESEKDLIESLELEPEEPYVLNYLAYSWLERNINLDKSIEMLRIALNKKQEDPYIIDSLGWGMYLVGNYSEAEKLLQRAVQLMPLDPIVNDHYADILWKLNKNLQANYFWNYVLSLDTTEDEMKEKIKKKLIFGISNHS